MQKRWVLFRFTNALRHLRRNMGLSDCLNKEGEPTFLGALTALGASQWHNEQCPCLIRFCHPSARCLPWEPQSRCPLRRPDCPFLIQLLENQGPSTTQQRRLYHSWQCSDIRTQNQSVDGFHSFLPFLLQCRIWMTTISALNLALIILHMCYKRLSSLKRCISTLIPALGKNFNLFKLTLAIIAVWNKSIDCFLRK